MAVYGYVRVSTDMQAEDGQSLVVQQRQLEGWAMQHGRTFDAMHIEAGISGAVPFAERLRSPDRYFACGGTNVG